MKFLIINIFCFVTLAMLAMLSILRQRIAVPREFLRNRIRRLIGGHVATKAPAIVLKKSDQLSEIPWFNRLLHHLRVALNLRRLLEQADVRMRVGEFILYSALASMLGWTIAWLLNNAVLRIALPSALGYAPVFWLKWLRRRRLKKFERQFPDALDLMTTALRAGHSFPGALQLVGQEAPAPASTEFQKTFEEQNLGKPMDRALHDLTDRVESLDLRFFVTAVSIQRETGGNLSEILTNISRTVRERFKVLGQIKTFTAQGRFSGMILAFMPVAFGVLIWFIDPNYIIVFFNDPLGYYLLGLAFVLQLIGNFFIRKIVNIDI